MSSQHSSSWPVCPALTNWPCIGFEVQLVCLSISNKPTSQNRICGARIPYLCSTTGVDQLIFANRELRALRLRSSSFQENR